MAKQPKFIFITGGVLSGVGKGITAAALGTVLKSRGFKINIQKLDPYLNVDAGTLNPGEHGEVFVTDDGAETDLDIGHYERFLDRNLDSKSSLMAGYIFNKVLSQEREGKYLGKTIQIIPHIVNEIQEHVIIAAKGFDIHIAEVGGTVGDYEGLHFMEALRQMRRIVGHDNVLYAHVPFLPYLETSGEVKTKPAQNSVRDLRELGISPDLIFPRSDHRIDEALIQKLSLYCDVEPEAIIPMVTAKTIYEVPLVLEKYKVADLVLEKFGLKSKKPDLKEWSSLYETITKTKPKVRIGLVAKYLANKDTYLSVNEALSSAGWSNGVDVEIIWIDAEAVEKDKSDSLLENIDGFVVPGGFGDRGTEGKIKAAKYAREKLIPYLGLCLGMQTGTVEFARNVCNMNNANSTEFNEETPYPVIYIMPDQKNIKNKGGTMRLGAYPCVIKKGTKVYDLYKDFDYGKPHKDGLLVSERHRHRYEFNMKYRKELEKCGLVIAGTSPEGVLVEMTELKNHPFFIATQAHPEFKSRPSRPHPLFKGFVKACIKKS